MYIYRCLECARAKLSLPVLVKELNDDCRRALLFILFGRIEMSPSCACVVVLFPRNAGEMVLYSGLPASCGHKSEPLEIADIRVSQCSFSDLRVSTVEPACRG